MLTAPIPSNESDRLAALRALHLLDTPNETRFDRITKLVADLFHVPISYIALIDSDRQWFKSKCGLTVDETGREISFCGHAIMQDEPLVVYDTLEDDRFADNPLVIDQPGIRFYTGIPLAGPNGFKVGTLCIADTKPWQPDNLNLQLLLKLAELAQHELNMLDLIRTQNELIEAKSLVLRTRDQLDQELKEAADYVYSLIPPAISEGPILTHWTFETCNELGGDILGHFYLSETELAVYLVDVMGHGVGAALHASALQSALLHQLLPDCDFKDPSCVYKSLNKRFPMDAHGGRFFTMFYAVIDLETRKIRYVNGGHPPPFIIGGFSGPRTLDATTTIVGIGESSDFPVGEETLQANEHLWIYSDGAIEINDSSGQELGINGFRQATSVVMSANPENPTKAMRDLLSSFNDGQAFADDLSLIHIGWNPQHG